MMKPEMETTQLSLFSNPEQNPLRKQKTAKLGRYERIQRELETGDSDPYKTFVDISSLPTPPSNYTFVDLFSGSDSALHPRYVGAV
ncbi:DNA-cytosine methyltransferase [uncultured Coleofasciculus sp.]|uniref:DNA-cytosine methyltransferase n=1 Tax=uncultured Coleofasciculus sp. TaxID=1267456 RepID=A0A6J4J5A8_9CYAN|nr:DNA-cytosine methyltransferase [uncultured Coleofasciculus sp.]